MDLSLERDSSALGSLFQQIINDMKNTSPLWEDFVAKAGKLHTCLRAAIQAIAAYLDAFQKIADAATNSRGASKEIGTALTRVCLRHKAVETRLKTFTSAIMDCLVQPLQERIEDWKRTVATIDKDHAKEYKRCRTELKKRSSDTLRLQKKARKGQTDGLQSLMDSHMQDVTLRRAELEEVEKKSLRSAMVEERLRYCSFVHMLQPVVHEECEVMSELGHLQEAMQSIALVTKEPSVLPQASEELIHDAKASINLYPESPGGGSGSQGGGCSNSLGSRKSSVCSISSMNSSGSSNSPGHHHYPRSLSQFVTPAIRLKPGESSDSGFCSSPALTTQTSNATNQTANVSTWPPHSQDGVDTLPPTADRPHTISTAYEKGHQRPPLTVYTFQNPETIHESGSCLNNGTAAPNGQPLSGQATPATQKSPAASLSRPPLPVRCSSLERPLSAQSNHRQGSGSNLLQRQCPSPIPAHITKELSAAHHAQQQQQQQQNQNQQPQTPPTYVNMSELATMAALKQTNQQQKTSTPPLQQQSSIDSTCSQHSNDSTGSHQLLQQQQQHQSQQNHHSATATRSHSISSTASSLHSHPSIDSTVACGSLVGQHNHSTSTNTNTNTTSPSSGSSTPQNHYSPLLTNSPTSTAAGTPSGSSLGPGSGLGFVYQVSSPTPPSSEVLKITEQGAAGQDQGTGSANSVADEMDERSRASVLQKASMFEKAAAAAAVAVSPPASIQVASSAPASGGGTRRSEAEQQEMDKSFEDSIQALNNLIGELDSFQREIDEGKVKPPSSTNNISSSNNNMTTSSNSSSDNNNLPATSNIEPCAISNQTNSSGCGTDISDTTSDELAGDDMDVRQRDRDRDLLGASDSELSRCYVSETSSLTGGLTAGGYENPTFAHFAANANRDDAVSLASDSVCLGQPRHAYVDTCSDSGSAVVVIYDHQIPNTPDIEFVKQNSEIVVLRTKDPQPHALQLHEMRELQQLPTNLAASPDSSPDSAAGQAPPTATVAPAKQRLSSFRATSEQQLQLLGRGSPQRGGAASGGSTRIGRRASINQAKPPPPVRRSSSVTPSPNASVGLQQQPQHATLSQQNHQLSSSSEHLPPPPPFMLDAMAQIPSSALKVSETSAHNSPSNDDLTVFHDYLDLHAYAQALATGQQPGGQQMANPQRFFHQQQHQHQHQLPPPPVYQVDATFRTSSPAAGGGGGGSIYAQPKLVNSMSSFRTSSPSPNGHAHPLPPTQPKANPNLIAQLNARLSGKQQQQQQQQQQVEGIYGNQQTPGGESIYMRSGLPMSQPQQQQHYDAAAQSPNMRQAHSHQHHQQPQQHYTCPPPLEDPPPPPIYAASASATMPKKVARPPTGQNTSHSSAYAAASSTATLPRNMMQHQQRLQQQQQQQYQQPASIGIGIGNGNGHLGQRPQLPLPQQKLRAAQQQHLAEQQQHQPQQQHQLQHQQHQQHQQRQPPIPSRHSSVQQKIFVSTNPFIQTTAVKFHSPSASPTCGSPVTGSGSGSLASIYATTSRGGHHHQQQQQQQQQQAQQQHYYRDAAGGNSNGGAAYYNHNAHAHSPAHHPTGPSHLSRIADGSNKARSHLKA
ncbi:flocculation protein FLO11 isoform X43 [Drosophila santomea]|uniref:flocculation protein FLO11 isoform X43 n=1 Tax=Drosophila santomea TaxID=129105 RepID=UPI001CCF7A0C|nr:flocculation protein FLO11 isoform X43 [Drosophila santomea]